MVFIPEDPRNRRGHTHNHQHGGRVPTSLMNLMRCVCSPEPAQQRHGLRQIWSPVKGRCTSQLGWERKSANLGSPTRRHAQREEAWSSSSFPRGLVQGTGCGDPCTALPRGFLPQ